MREVETAATAAAPEPLGEPLESWEVAAVGPEWTPVVGEMELEPVPGRLELYADALVFRADDAVDRRTREPLVSVVPAGTVTGATPLAPGSKLSSAQRGGSPVGRLLGRLAPPGFVVSTSVGPWAFACSRGERRAREVSRRYAGAG